MHPGLSLPGHVVSTERARLPKPGEQITFEQGDCQSRKERFVLRVVKTTAGCVGMVTLSGYRLDGHGFPAEEISVNVPVAVVEARRVHR